MIYFDTETCGFHGPIVLLQWQENREIHLYDMWEGSIRTAKRHLEMLVNYPDGVCGFNLTFDWFHVCQMHSTLALLDGEDDILRNRIDDYAVAEEQARWTAPCYKPHRSLDLYLHACKGPYQSTMDRKDIRIKKVPTQLAPKLAEELDKRIPFKDIYFARKSDTSQRWQVFDRHDESGNLDPYFKDIVVKFAPSKALKVLVADAFGSDTIAFHDIQPPKRSRPEELGYAPFAMAIGKPGKWRGAWPDHGKIRTHIDHWKYNSRAREYAADDVKYLLMLDEYFKYPEPNDLDSQLACMIASERWHGYAIDTGDKCDCEEPGSLKQARDSCPECKGSGYTGIKGLKVKSIRVIRNAAGNFNSHDVCVTYLSEVLSDVEKAVLLVNEKITTKATVLEAIAKWTKEDICTLCNGEGCDECDDTGLIQSGERHPAAIRAQEIIDYRRAQKEINLYDKLLLANRFHASFKPIGALSYRMSGADGLNPQGINRDKTVRACFTLADSGHILCGGDFVSNQIVIADAVYGDTKLREDLLTKRMCTDCKGEGTLTQKDGSQAPCAECEGTGKTRSSMHALFGTVLFPGMSYEDIVATKGLPGSRDRYTRSKNGVFALLFGGNEFTLQNRVGITEEAALVAYQRWIERYPTWGKERKKIFDMFCSMRQPGGIGSKVEWATPAPFAESMFGFRRYFTIENQICKVLFDLATDPPKDWLRLKIKVIRRDREQTLSGATRSSLYAAAFATQAANMRAAANHVIQSPEATIVKSLQCEVWKFQPTGIHSWVVMPLNVHDELEVPCIPEVAEPMEKAVFDHVETFRDKIPLIQIDWNNNLSSWAAK